MLVRLAAVRRGARNETIVIRAFGSTAVAVEWGVRRRSSVILDLTGKERAHDSWPRLPGLIPTDARHIQDRALAPGVSLVTYTLTSAGSDHHAQ